jgi:hypothetical protein
VAQYRGTNTTAGQDIELWTARVNRAHTPLTVTSSMTGTPPWLQSLTVMALDHAAGVGAIAKGCYSSSQCTSANPIPSVSLTPTQTGSMIIGVGYDYSDNVKKSVARGQTLDQQAFDTTERATMWVQHANASTTQGSPVNISSTPAGTDNWALVVFEIMPR